MIGYVTLGTNKFEESAKFYDELLAVIGAKRMMGDDTFIAWAVDPAKPALSIIKPHNKEEATVGNGTMIALAMPNPEMVDKLYGKAIELGAQCEGPAGARSENFYAGYFRDPDGNKLNAFCMTGQG